jgi:hypothetical protein
VVLWQNIGFLFSQSINVFNAANVLPLAKIFPNLIQVCRMSPTQIYAARIVLNASKPAKIMSSEFFARNDRAIAVLSDFFLTIVILFLLSEIAFII